jgi:hypothetical protein
MDIFLNKHQESILGVVEGFDRIIFKGYLTECGQPIDVPMFTYGDGCGDMLNALSVARSWTTVGQERPRRVDPGALPQTPHSP